MQMQLLTSQLNLSPRSLVIAKGVEFGLANTQACRRLVALAEPADKILQLFQGECTEFDQQSLLVCPLSPENACILRNELGWLKPQLLGLNTSAGMGDRMGIATPGHVRAVRHTQGKVKPIFAQQSMREMRRTGRSPQQVMDDATWGMFEEGWQAGAGADADHLKTLEDIEACLAAGFTFFTIDPGEYVNNQILSENYDQLKVYIDTLPKELQPEATGLRKKTFDIEGSQVRFTDEVMFKAMAKYGRAIVQVKAMVEHLAEIAEGHPYEVEISMDETDEPTSPAEHIYIASELRRLGVKWVSFAPRFVGKFEKGVDYIGDVHAFETELAMHAAIARELGPYKLSLHSGSDKFSIYGLFMDHTHGLAHLKTAGTSYLEALRTIASVDRQLMKEIYTFALEWFETDKRSYHISAETRKAPNPGEIKDWTSLFEQFDARQVLHVTFGSVLTERAADGTRRFYDRIMSTLQGSREMYFDNLERHFTRHLEPFSR